MINKIVRFNRDCNHPQCNAQRFRRIAAGSLYVWRYAHFSDRTESTIIIDNKILLSCLHQLYISIILFNYVF